MIRQFLSWFIPSAIGAVSLIWVGTNLGYTALATAVLLIVLEITLSFDNAVVNAGVLRHMSPIWRRRFLTWGIAIAVFGSRALLPVLIVSLSTWISPVTIAWIALNDPTQYGELLHGAMFVINTFGGMFLAMVAFKYFFNEKKQRHWIHTIEKYLAQWGNVEAIEILLSILILMPIAALVPSHHYEVLFSGLVGIVLFIVIHQIIAAFSVDTESQIIPASGFAMFAYLNMLDAAFSLDSVVGAFALTSNIVVIALGLGIGAYFVRSLTLLLVERGTLDELIYIEHGAHWAILGLAIVMLAGLFVTVPEPITGFIGFVFLTLAYISSRRAQI